MVKVALLRGTQHVDGVGARDWAVGECAYHCHGFYEECSLRERGKRWWERRGAMHGWERAEESRCDVVRDIAY